MSDEIIRRLDELKAGQAGIRGEIAELKAGQDRLWRLLTEFSESNSATSEGILGAMRAIEGKLDSYGENTEEKLARVARMLERLAIARAS